MKVDHISGSKVLYSLFWLYAKFGCMQSFAPHLFLLGWLKLNLALLLDQLRLA